jgi:protease IV
MKQFLVTLAGVFCGLLLFFLGLPLLVLAIAAGSSQPAPTPANTILSLDLRQSLSDQDPNTPFAFLNGRTLSVVSVVSTLSRAAHDPSVKALLIRLPEGGLPPAQADEIRLALKGFEASGKPAAAFSQGIYPSGVSTATYMLGAAANQFWMQPGSELQSTGLASEDLFLKRFFDKYGLSADFQQREQYKNAVNPLLYDDYTPAHREAELGWMTSVYDTEMTTAARDRGLDPTVVKASLAAGPYSAVQAKAQHLVDQVGDLQTAVASLGAQAGPGAKLVDFATYKGSRRSVTSSDSGPAIALIGAEGDIVTGTGDTQGLTNNKAGIYSDDVSKAFQAAIDDAQVKAIVFRVSSPGGSDTASAQIGSALQAARAAHKPVVVSMGTYAASGGYWISAGADEIVAEPTTLTGSIGVFGGKIVTGPALARFGLDLRDLSVGGDFSGAYGSAQPFTSAQRATLSAWMDRIYQSFIQHVADGRHLTPARVSEIAKGRVWTGAQAKQLGLVDKIGGLALAVADAKRLAGIAPNQPALLKLTPSKKSPLDFLSRVMGTGATSMHTLATVGWLLSDPRAQSALDEMGRLRLQAEGQGAVLAPISVH